MKKIYLWLLVGVILVTGVFFIPEQSGSLWPSLMLSSGVALLYLIAFSIRWLREIPSKISRRVIAVTLCVLVLASSAFATLSYVESKKQGRLLSEIRTSIEQNILYKNINHPLSKALSAYYTSSKKDLEIRRLFVSKYDSLITDNGLFLVEGMQDEAATFVIYVAKTEPESVVLIGESTYIDGKDENFHNFSGETGLYQVKGILTKEGVYYERSN
ncbi:MAG TPA: hypothetical protein VF181_11885 [Balneolaceae bacterium]